MHIAWAFKGTRLTGHADLVDAYREVDFDSPTRSTIPLLELWRSPKRRARELGEALAISPPAQVQLDFEHLVWPPRGKGRPSHTDLMVISHEAALAIEAKWTEPRYPEVGERLPTTKNGAEVLRGWCDLLELRGDGLVREADLYELPYQMVHRAASACHVEDVPRRWLVYLVFEMTAHKRTEYIADLRQLRDALGPSSTLGIALVEGTIEESTLLIGLRDRWNRGERGLHEPVRRHVRTGSLLTARLGRVCIVSTAGDDT